MKCPKQEEAQDCEALGVLMGSMYSIYVLINVLNLIRMMCFDALTDFNTTNTLYTNKHILM